MLIFIGFNVKQNKGIKMKLKALLFGAVAAISLSLSMPSQAYNGDGLWAIDCFATDINGGSIFAEIADGSRNLQYWINQCYIQGGFPLVEFIG